MLFLDEVLKKIEGFFTLLIFGSYAAGKETKDSEKWMNNEVKEIKL